jgi:hypothetical protein
MEEVFVPASASLVALRAALSGTYPDELQNQNNSKACKSNDLQAFLFQIPW